MKISELQDIAEKLLDAYGSGRHWEIISASNLEGDGWLITVKKYNEGTKSKGAKNADNK